MPREPDTAATPATPEAPATAASRAVPPTQGTPATAAAPSTGTIATAATDAVTAVTAASAAPAGAARCRRVGHAIVKPGLGLAELERRLQLAEWDMVELDVLRRDGELIVAHDPSDFDHPERIAFTDALRALRDLLPPETGLNVDIKTTGYELAVLDELRALDLAERALISTMEVASLRTLRAAAPDLRLGLSVPRARRNYLAHPLTRPGAHLMLAGLRRALPRRVAAALRSGLAEAIMAHHGVITPQLVATVDQLGGELYAWTVDDPGLLGGLERLGVTGVITNDPDLFTRRDPALTP